MIRIGVTDSPRARRLIQDGSLPVDYLEVHGPNLEAARGQLPDFPMLLHNSLYQWSLADPQALQSRSAAQVTLQRLKQSCSPWYSVHLGFSAAEVDFDEIAFAKSEILDPGQIFEYTCHTVKELRNLTGIPLLLENLDYNPGGAYETVCEPGFMTAVLEATGADLLLDIAHAQVSAAAFGISLEDYLSGLPLDRVRQIHINRPGIHNGRLYDLHAVLQEADYLLLSSLLKRCQTAPWAITLEYNQDDNVILSQIEHLKELVK